MSMIPMLIVMKLFRFLKIIEKIPIEPQYIYTYTVHRERVCVSGRIYES